MISIPESAKREIEASFLVDPTPGPRGPIQVSRAFLEGLKSIDRRLELRWLPMVGIYAVFLRFPYSNALWRSAVHPITNESGGFRAPGECDLSAIRKAKHMMESSGATGFIGEMDKFLAAQKRRSQESRDKAIEREADRLCKDYDLSRKDFLVTNRGSLVPDRTGPKTATCFQRVTRHGSD